MTANSWLCKLTSSDSWEARQGSRDNGSGSSRQTARVFCCVTMGQSLCLSVPQFPAECLPRAGKCAQYIVRIVFGSLALQGN